MATPTITADTKKRKVMAVPHADQLSTYYQSYLKYLNPEEDLLAMLKSQQVATRQMLDEVQPEKETFCYAPGKWMLKEVAGHVCDTERILSYRALTIARGDQTPLPGFDENAYTTASNYKNRTLQNITEELYIVRSATLILFENMDLEMYDIKGTANDSPVTVRSLCFFICAHQRHHLQVIRERYLSS